MKSMNHLKRTVTDCTFQVFNIRCPEMHTVQRAKCARSKLMYSFSVCTDDNHSLKLVAYRLVHTDEPYINLHVYHKIHMYIPDGVINFRFIDYTNRHLFII